MIPNDEDYNFDEFRKHGLNEIIDDSGNISDIRDYLLSIRFTVFDTFFEFKEKYLFRLSDFYTKRDVRSFKKAKNGYQVISHIHGKDEYETLSEKDIEEILEIKNSFKVENYICKEIFNKTIKKLSLELYKLSDEDNTKCPLRSNKNKANLIHGELKILFEKKYGERVLKSFPSVNSIRSQIPTKRDFYKY